MDGSQLRRAARTARDELRDLAHPLVEALNAAIYTADTATLAGICDRVVVEMDAFQEPSVGMAMLETALETYRADAA